MIIFPTILVELDPSEMDAGERCGRARNDASVGRPMSAGLTGTDGYKEHIGGARGEIACAKGLHRQWFPTVNTFKNPDILCPDLTFHLEVRTRTLSWHQLYMRPDDIPELGFVLVFAQPPKYEIKGYRIGVDIKKIGKWDDPGGRDPAWWVQTTDLWPPQDLLLK